MAAESNTGCHQQAILFSPEMFSMGYYNQLEGDLSVNNSTDLTGGGNSGGGGGMVFSASRSLVTNSSTNNNRTTSMISHSGSSAGSLLLDTVPGLKHDAGLAVEWSVEEQYKLEEGLVKFADEPSIMRYIKIAATLRDKTVRDVALRCRWMTRKRKKQEEYNLGKKLKDRKDSLAESSLKPSVSTASPINMAAYSISMNRGDQSDCTPSGVLLGGTRNVLEETNQALNQISVNISTLKLQENIDLFLRTSNNITAILNDMRNTPGIMSQMPPLPVGLNEELTSSILPSSTQPLIFGSPSGIHLKQEPRC